MMNRPLLRFGSRGPDVNLLQRALNHSRASAIPLEVDGIFGQLTASAVRAFQQLKQLVPDSIVGQQTHLSLEEAYKALEKLIDEHLVPPADELEARDRIVAIAKAQSAAFGWPLGQDPPIPFNPRIAIRYMTDEKTRARQGGGPLSIIFAMAGESATQCLKIPAGMAHGEITEEEYKDRRNREDLEHWCGMFALFVLKSAGLKMGNWSDGPFLPFRGKVNAVAPKNIQPGDIGIIEPFGGRNHHFVVIGIDGDMVHSIDGNAGLYHSIFQRKYQLANPHQTTATETGAKAIPGVFGVERCFFVAPRFSELLK